MTLYLILPFFLFPLSTPNRYTGVEQVDGP